MISRWVRAVALVVLAAPAAALAFETVDALPFPSSGVFPGWASDVPVAPLNLFAYGGLMYDTNALRVSSGEQSDLVARVGAGARYAARIVGRQRVLLEGFGEYYDFHDLNEIDHFGYGLRGDWLWEIGNQLSGVVGYTRRHRHADLGEFGAERREMVTTDRLSVDGGYRFAPNWRVYAGALGTRAEREGETEADFDAATVRGGLAYGTPLGNDLGVEVRATRGDERFRDALSGLEVTDDYDEHELAFTFIYRLGEQLRTAGRIGRTERNYENAPDRDFSGTTYRGRLDWLPTGKLMFSLEAYREPTALVDIAASHVLRTGFDFGVSYAPTFKLVFTAHYVRDHRLLEGDFDVTLLRTPVPGDELVRTWRFGVGWEPMRHWQLGAGVDFGDRSSNVLGRDYDYQQYMVNVRWTF